MFKINKDIDYIFRHLTNEYDNETKINSQQCKQKSPADARVTHDSAIIPRWPSAAILDIIKPQIAPFDPPTSKTLA